LRGWVNLAMVSSRRFIWRLNVKYHHFMGELRWARRILKSKEKIVESA